MKASVKYLEVGSIGRTFGKNGHLQLNLSDQIDIEEDEIDHFYLWVKGQYLPFFIKEYKFDPDLVLFEETSGLEAASAISNKPIFVSDMQIEFDDYKETQAMKSDLVGFNIVDQTSGKTLQIKSIEEFPSQTMIIATQENIEGDVLIPFVEEWLVKLDPKKKQIFMNLPLGLI